MPFRLWLPLVLLVLVPAACRPSPPIGSEPTAAPAAHPEETPQGVGVRGRITHLNRDAGAGEKLGTILVEGTKEPDTSVDKASITITTGTRIFRNEYGDRLATLDDLTVGDLVEVRFKGPVMESYPVQAWGDEVVLLRHGAPQSVPAAAAEPLNPPPTLATPPPSH